MSDPRVIDMPVRRVTAYEDRAALRRVETLTLTPGRHQIIVPGVTPLGVDGRLDARVEAGAATVEDARAVRRLEVRSGDGDARRERFAAETAAAAEAHLDADAELQRLTRLRNAARALHSRGFAALMRAAWAGEEAAPAALRANLARLEAQVDEAEAALRAAVARRSAVSLAMQRARSLASAIPPAESRLVCDLAVQLRVDAAGPVTLAIEMVVPCALWRPAHEAALDAGGALTWTALATAWQATGEDWTDVELVFSTARPSAGAELPAVREDRLRLQPRNEPKKRVVLAHRNEAIAKDKGDDAVPGVYDGGEARVFCARGRVDLPSDGRPHRFELGDFRTEARVARIARPEIAAQVFEIAALRNAAEWPLLAGPVALRRDGAFVGTGDVAYVGPGEPFELAFGSDDRWTLKCRREQQIEKRALVRDRTHFVTEVDLDYTGAGRGEVTVELRLPCSEIEALEVHPSTQFCSEGTPKPDADGIVRWPITCVAGERRAVQLGFWFDKSGDVVLPDPW
ncbi:MAG: DUF4139 domain-containing protein [Myxococcales bacterium]|nr:DUF4139 domain-containing protein [Myxococcales bacterium]